MKTKYIITIAAVLGALAVVLGAFGAHGLKSQISAERLETYQLGVTYQYYHVMAILVCGLLNKNLNLKLLGTAALLFMIGILLFSGSLYLLATRDLLSINRLLPIIGPLTPIGGLFFIGGWSLMAFAALKIKEN